MFKDLDPRVGGAFAYDKFVKAGKWAKEADRRQTRMGEITGRQTMLYFPKPRASDYGTPPAYFNAVPTPEYTKPSIPPTDYIRNPPMTRRATGRKYTERKRRGNTVGTY